MTASDVESLQPRAGSGDRCLHAFLITSVITLFVLLSGVTVTAALFIRQMQAELVNLTKSSHEPTAVMSPLKMPENKSEYKVQNFALLRADSGKLENGNLKLKAESVGSSYTFRALQHALQPHVEGSYLLYVDLALRCRTHVCDAVKVTVQVHQDESKRSLLECQADAQHGRVKCWEVVRLTAQQRVVATMEAHDATDSWELDTEKSGLGMFLVDWQTR